MACSTDWPRQYASRRVNGEAAFIDALRALATSPEARGLADDAAVFDGQQGMVVTHDTMVEEVHFLSQQDPADVAWKLVAVNVSDLAAKGARPVAGLLSYTLSDWDERFLAGLSAALGHFDVGLWGGDTVSSAGPRVFGFTAIGRASHLPVPSRAGAQAGEGLFVSGPLGAAMMGYEALRDGTGADSRAYRRPDIDIARGVLVAGLSRAVMDISDGLLLDAWRMAEASQVSLAIESRAVPLAAPEARRHDALIWGDDYQLLFTLPPDQAHLVPFATRIGAVEPRGFAPLFLDGEHIVNQAGLGYRHH